jgi:hypothetical protein
LGVFGSCLPNDGGVLGEPQRLGLQVGRLGELLKGAGVAVKAGGVPGLGRELREERAVAVRGCVGGGAFGLRFAGSGGRADGFGDGVRG